MFKKHFWIFLQKKTTKEKKTEIESTTPSLDGIEFEL
jgi:hypothetical protein